MSFSYLMWHMTSKSHTKVGKWINSNMGTQPVLVSDVNPLLRTTVATNTLAAHGYFRGTADYDEIVQKDPKKAKIQYIVDFGPLFRIDSIEYRNYPARMRALIDSTRVQSVLHKGDGFDVSTLDEERQRLSTLFRNNGYYFYQPGSSSYLADTIQNPLNVQLRLQYNDSIGSLSSRQWKIGRTHIYLRRNNERQETTDSISRRRLTIHYNGKRPPVKARVFMSDVLLRPGMMYSEKKFRESINRLQRFNAFSNIDLTLVPTDTTQENSLLDLNVNCTLDKPWDASIEGTLTGKTSSRFGPGAEFTLTRKNPFRGAEKLSFNLYGSYEWQFGGSATGNKLARNSYEYGYGVTLDMPTLLLPNVIKRKLRLDPSTRIKLSNAVLNRGSYFNRHILSAELSYTYHPNRFQEHTLTPLSLEYDYMRKHSAEFDKILEDNVYMRMMMQDQFMPQMKYSYSYTTQGKKADPVTASIAFSESGNILSLGYLCAGKSLGQKNKKMFGNPFAQFLKIESHLSKCWQFGGKSSVVAHTNIGVVWSYGNSEMAPYSEQFFVGGANSIRAFTSRSIGPGSFKAETAESSYATQVGDFKFVANVEYRPHLFGSLYGAAFLDLGNVWNLKNNLCAKTFFEDMALGTGIGIRYDLDFFVFRLDWGIGLHLPFDTGKSGYFNINHFKDVQTLHLAIGYPF